MPCSALKLPLNSPHDVVNHAAQLVFNGLQLRGMTAVPLVDVEMKVAVAEMPVRDEQSLRNVFRDPLAGALDEGGTLDTGTEMSCLRLGPSLRCASGIVSRSRQNASRSRAAQRDGAIEHPAGFVRIGQGLFEQRLERLAGARAR